MRGRPSRRVPALPRALAALALAVIACGPATALAAVPPHVTETTVSPDACAICHRAHTSNVELSYRTTASVDPTGNALIVAPPSAVGAPGFPEPKNGDVGLCFTCHGAAGLGSQFDVETPFSLVSTHTIAPLASAFGPSPKMCGSCHDPHGTDRAVGGNPYPRLLRSWVDTTTAVFTREEYCASCHTTRPASRFDSVAVYRRTGHYTGMPDPGSGTLVRCMDCHAAHGSSIAPLVLTKVKPATSATVTVSANDRRLCIACHPDPAHTWSGETTYALSAHAASAKTTPVIGEWPAAGSTRRVGECQVCHAPMGRDDGAGGTITKLGEKAGRQLCDTCHQLPGGPATTDIKSLAYPSTESSSVELVVAWAPDPRGVFAGRTDLYGRATSGADPRPLIGPRPYAAPGASGAAAAGDVDGDGSVELVRADAAAKTLTILHRDALLGLRATAPQLIDGTPDFIVIGRFVEPIAAETLAGSGARPQIAVVDATAGKLWVYENLVGGALALIDSGAGDGSYALGGTGTGLAAGDFTGGALPDLAVTINAPDQLLLFTQDGGSLAQLAAPTVAAPPLASPPRGPSIGNVTGTAASEIAICSPDGMVRLFDGTGTAVAAVGPIAIAGTPWATAIGDVYPGAAGNEVAVAMRDADARLALFTGAGVQTAAPNVAGAPTARAGSLLIADVDGDTVAETLLGNAGEWNGATGMSAPTVDVYRPDGAGTALVHGTTLEAGGSALAGRAPTLLAADFGPVLPSRHPVDEVSASHVSTETGAFARHVTCSDCHDSHEASSGITASAPLVTGDMRGAWGRAVTNTGAGSAYTPAPAMRAVRQYEVCFKCHATTADGRADIAALVNDQNASVHAVEGVSAAPAALANSYEPGWSNASVLYCSDCHGNSAAPPQAKGSHRSGEAPVLKKPFAATPAQAADLLCYTCHRRTTYYVGLGTGGTDGDAGPDTTYSSRFFDDLHFGASASGGSLHSYHVDTWADGGLGLACDSCHASHGSPTLEHLIRADIGFVHAAPNGGSCTNACHGAKVYDFDLP